MQWVKRGGGASSIRTRVSLIGGGMSPACATHNVYYTYTHIHTDIHRYTHNVYYTYTHRYTHKYTDIHICKYIYIYIYHICRFMCCFHDFYEKVYDHHHDGGGDPNDNLCRIEKCYLRNLSPSEIHLVGQITIASINTNNSDPSPLFIVQIVTIFLIIIEQIPIY